MFHTNALIMWVVQGFLSWLSCPMLKPTSLLPVEINWMESLKSLLPKTVCINCSTLYVVMRFLQFVSSYLFELYLVLVLTLANIRMSQILFAKESQILFAKEFLWYYYIASVQLPVFLVQNFKLHFNSWHKFGNWQRIFTFVICNYFGSRFRKQPWGSVWIDFTDKFLLIDRFFAEFPKPFIHSKCNLL